MDDGELQAVRDELAIRNLIARLARLADTCPIEDLERDYLPLFTSDAVWEIPGDRRTGQAAILEGAQDRRRSGAQGPGAGSRHLVSTIEVHADGSDTATADSYLVVVGDTTTTPTVRMTAQYRDTFRRDGGTWRMAERLVTFG
jgi:hypothetical protein